MGLMQKLAGRAVVDGLAVCVMMKKGAEECGKRKDYSQRE